MWPCNNLLAAHERHQIRDTHGEMNIDFSLWPGDYYCVYVPRLKKASNRVKITTAKTGEWGAGLQKINSVLNLRTGRAVFQIKIQSVGRCCSLYDVVFPVH